MSHLEQMFFSTHYVGEDIAIKFESGEYWKKVLGPIYVYLNSDIKAKPNPSVLWNDAKQRVRLRLCLVKLSFKILKFKQTSSWLFLIWVQSLTHHWSLIVFVLGKLMDMQMQKEVASWPYNFPLSKDFLKSNQRGAVSGQLLVHDWYVCTSF